MSRDVGKFTDQAQNEDHILGSAYTTISEPAT